VIPDLIPDLIHGRIQPYLGQGGACGAAGPHRLAVHAPRSPVQRPAVFLARHCPAGGRRAMPPTGVASARLRRALARRSLARIPRRRPFGKAKEPSCARSAVPESRVCQLGWIFPGRQVCSNQGSRGPYRRRMGNQLLPGMVCSQLASACAGGPGPNLMMASPRRTAGSRTRRRHRSR